MPPGDGNPGAPAVRSRNERPPSKVSKTYSHSNQLYTQVQGSRATHRHDRTFRFSPCPPGFREKLRRHHGRRLTNKPSYSSQVCVAPGRNGAALCNPTSSIYRFAAGTWIHGSDRADPRHQPRLSEADGSPNAKPQISRACTHEVAFSGQPSPQCKVCCAFDEHSTRPVPCPAWLVRLAGLPGRCARSSGRPPPTPGRVNLYVSYFALQFEMHDCILICNTFSGNLRCFQGWSCSSFCRYRVWRPRAARVQYG